MLKTNKIYVGDCRKVLQKFPQESIDMVVTSPPYWNLRDYETTPLDWDGWKGSLGQEPIPKMFVDHLCDIFDQVKRVLKSEGTLWVNLGDTYNGSGGAGSQYSKYRKKDKHKQFGKVVNGVGQSLPAYTKKYPRKSLLLIPSRFAIEMVDRGWILRNTIIWKKKNPMPSSVKDRYTCDFEKLYFFSKNPKYYFKQQFEKLLRPNAKGMKFGGNKADGYGNPTYSGRVYDASKNYKYKDIDHETEHRQGMNKERGTNIIEERRNLPSQKTFVDRIRAYYTIDGIVKNTGLKRTKVEHWFRKDEEGFSYPSKEDWLKMKTKMFPALVKTYKKKDAVLNYDLKYGNTNMNAESIGHYSEKIRTDSREKAKELYPNSPKKQQKYINWVHDHGETGMRNKRTTWEAKKPYSVIEPAFRKDVIEYRELPNHDEFREYLSKVRKKSNITIQGLENDFMTQAPHHWFEKGGSYPSVDDWKHLKVLFQLGEDSKYEKAMTTIYYKSGLKQDYPQGPNKRTTWSISTSQYKGSHFAVFPRELIRSPIDAGCPKGGIVMDIFGGSGTTAEEALYQGKKFVLIELNKEYAKLAFKRIKGMIGQKKVF